MKFTKTNANLVQENIPIKEYLPIQPKGEKIKQAPTVLLVEQPSISLQDPPFPKRLKIDKGIERKFVLPNYDMLDELRNICIKIPFLQAIKEIPIFSKTIKELCIRKPGRK